MPSILETTDYGRFDTEHLNREIHRNSYRFKNLVASMAKYGWIDAYPMHVFKNGARKFKVKAGHHRLAAAMELGISAKYVVCDGEASIHYLEQAGPGAWSAADFLHSYAKAGNEHYSTIKKYCEETGIGLTAAISMFGGHTANTGNFSRAFKTGEYRIRETSHPRMVAEISAIAKRAGFDGHRHRNFIFAISKALRTEGVDAQRLKQKLRAHPFVLKKQSTVEGYLGVLEDAYNRMAQDKFPLAFAAQESAKSRNIAQH